MSRDASPPADDRIAAEELAERTARLAELELGVEEIRLLGPQFARMLETFGTLSELDLSAAQAHAPHAPAGSSAATQEARVRKDTRKPSLPRDELLSLAPEPIDGFYGVPKILGGER